MQRRIQTKSKNRMDPGVADGRGEALAVGAGSLSPLFRRADFLEESRVCSGSRHRPWAVNAFGVKAQLARQIKRAEG